MLRSISWQTFLTTTTVILVLYYVAVSMFFYTSAIKQLFQGKFKKQEDVITNAKGNQPKVSQVSEHEERP